MVPERCLLVWEIDTCTHTHTRTHARTLEVGAEHKYPPREYLKNFVIFANSKKCLNVIKSDIEFILYI